LLSPAPLPTYAVSVASMAFFVCRRRQRPTSCRRSRAASSGGSRTLPPRAGRRRRSRCSSRWTCRPAMRRPASSSRTSPDHCRSRRESPGNSARRSANSSATRRPTSVRAASGRSLLQRARPRSRPRRPVRRPRTPGSSRGRGSPVRCSVAHWLGRRCAAPRLRKQRQLGCRVHHRRQPLAPFRGRQLGRAACRACRRRKLMRRPFRLCPPSHPIGTVLWAARQRGIDLDALSARAHQIHDALDDKAQIHRTAAVLSTDGPTIIAGGKVDLNKVQRGLLRKREIPAILPDTDAEQTALWKAIVRGHRPRAIAASRQFCPDCTRFIGAMGGIISPSGKTAIFPLF
jgi:hypothetical protein